VGVGQGQRILQQVAHGCPFWLYLGHPAQFAALCSHTACLPKVSLCAIQLTTPSVLWYAESVSYFLPTPVCPAVTPLLLCLLLWYHQGRKFGIRLWVLVTAVTPLRAYVHSRGLVLFSTHRCGRAGLGGAVCALGQACGGGEGRR
jgi:hypothetical protein